MASCSTTCAHCGRKFNRFDGCLLNIADDHLEQFYKLPFIVDALGDHKHPCLCTDCLSQQVKISIDWFKFKNGRWMTSNLAYILKERGLLDKFKTQLQSEDDHGMLPYKKSETRLLFNKYGLL